ADGQAVIEPVHVEYHAHSRAESSDASREREPRHARAAEAHRLVDAVDRERRDAVPLAVAGVAHLRRGPHEGPRAVEGGREAEGFLSHGALPPGGPSGGWPAASRP